MVVINIYEENLLSRVIIMVNHDDFNGDTLYL